MSIHLKKMLERKLKQDINISRLSARDDYMQITYATATTFKGRVESITRTVTNSKGQEIVSDTEILTLETNIHEDDRIWLPGEDETDTEICHLVKAVRKNPDESQTWYEVIVYL